MKSEQGAPSPLEPCRAHRAAVERFVAETLDPVHHPAVQAHLRRCPGCRAYRDWIRVHDRTARRLFITAERQKIDPGFIRDCLADGIG